MPLSSAEIPQIEGIISRLQEFELIPEREIKALCEKVRRAESVQRGAYSGRTEGCLGAAQGRPTLRAPAPAIALRRRAAAGRRDPPHHHHTHPYPPSRLPPRPLRGDSPLT